LQLDSILRAAFWVPAAFVAAPLAAATIGMRLKLGELRPQSR
jgi:hypothetical protein